MRATLTLTLLLSVCSWPHDSHQSLDADASLADVIQHLLAVQVEKRAQFDSSVRELTLDVGSEIYRTPIVDEYVAQVNQHCDQLTRAHWAGIREFVNGKRDFVLTELPAAFNRLVAQRPLAVQQQQLVQHYQRQIERDAAYYVDCVQAQLDILEARTIDNLDQAYADVLRLRRAAVAANRSESKFQEDYIALYETTRNLCRQNESHFWDVKAALANNLVKRSNLLANVISLRFEANTIELSVF